MLDQRTCEGPSMAFQNTLARIQSKFIASLPERLARILHLFDSISQGDDILGSLHGIEQELHKIAGVAGSVGHSRLGEHASELELRIAAYRAGDNSDVVIIADKIIAMTQFLSEIIDEHQRT
ncbi:Hpt domain-containing protein [Marivita sp. S2033]|uniref:Hpt domain-containing protein n=1 Tax=Marivita sp. S2033 TaxID=3373187 RepID=UPI003981A948